MRIITGAILIVGAIWLFTSALPYGASYGGMPVMFKLAFILAGLTAMLGLFYLFVGSVEAKENSRWYQFTIKSLLAITVMVALFFSGRALGLREASSPYLPSVAYPTPYSVSPVYVSPAVPAPASWTPAVSTYDSNSAIVPPPEPSGPSQTSPSSDSPSMPSTPSEAPATQTP
jgi:hypothetical protein